MLPDLSLAGRRGALVPPRVGAEGAGGGARGTQGAQGAQAAQAGLLRRRGDGARALQRLAVRARDAGLPPRRRGDARGGLAGPGAAVVLLLPQRAPGGGPEGAAEGAP